MSASNVCPACGAANGPASVFCVNCGTPLTARAGPAGYPPPGYPPPAPAPYPGYPPGVPYYPMPPPRTASFSDILSGMFDVWAKNFVNFFLVYLVLSLVTGGVGDILYYAIFRTFPSGGGVLPSVPATTDFVAVIAFAILAVILAAILTSIVTGGMTEYAVRRFRGEPMVVRQALQRGVQRFLSILGANVLVTLIVFALVLVPLLLLFPVLIIGGGNPAGMLLAICGLLLAFAVGGVIAIFVYISLSLYAPAIMMENAKAVGSLQRSWALTKGHRWSLFGAILVAAILGAIITGAITTAAGLARNPVVSLLATALASALVGSWLVILAGVAYDLILRVPTPIYGVPPPYAPPLMPPPPPPRP